MKKANPISLRMGYNIPWKNKTTGLGHNISILYQLTIRRWLFSTFSYYEKKAKNTCFLVDLYSHENSISFNFFLKLIFFRFKIRRKLWRFDYWYFFKRSRRFFRQLLLSFLFIRLESFFLKKLFFPLSFFWKNYADSIAVYPFVRLLYSYRRRLRRRYKSMRFFFKTYKYLLLFFFFKDVFLLGKLFTFLFSKTRKHKNVLKFLLNLIKFFWRFFPKLKVLHFCLSGRFNGKERTLRRWIRLGKHLKVQSFSESLQYYTNRIITPYGSLGLQIWLE